MRKRLVYRADDIGYTKTFNDGAFKAIENGIVTSADVMFDIPGAVDALERLRDYPWISVGWHSGHLWGSAVADPKLVPHMVDATGKFLWGHNSKLMADVPYEEAYIEFEAQVQLCIKTLGRAPDTTDVMFERPIDRAKMDVCDKYGIVYRFCGGINPSGISMVVKPEYQHLRYNEYADPNVPKRQPGHDRRKGFSLDQFHLYDPVSKIKGVTWESDEIWRVGGHPGFLDDYILSESSCNIHRVKDIIAVTSDELKAWIADEGIELVNQRDILFGTNEFQDHLRAIGSKMAIDANT